MKELLYILLCLSFVVMGAWNMWLSTTNDNSDKYVLKRIISIILLIILSFIAGMIYRDIDQERNPANPTAMDVYKGETSLRITYQDSIPVDSCVVFKDFE